FDNEVEPHPRHDLGVYVLGAPGSDLPDTVVGFVPALHDDSCDPTDEIPGIAVESPTRFPVQRKCPDHLTVDIELELFVSGVTDSDRTRAAVAGEIGAAVFGDLGLTEDVVEDAELGVGEA